ncbi:MAG: YdcF family protein, partial [Parasporobacterium sp.]|nr:YdcF family protein [Parasporobacterium sp.]
MDRGFAELINILGAFCGKRDISTLKGSCLQNKYGFSRADVMVLFGGSILAGGDVLAQAIHAGIARKYIIVGGNGHTTETLRSTVRREYPQIRTAGLPEAMIFQNYLRKVYGLEADYLETESTNCGNNVTNLLALMNDMGIQHRNIVLCQDASMQLRMDAGMRKYASDDMVIINYAAYAAKLVCKGNGLAYEEDIHGMWNIDRYINLLMGEIPRLKDDRNGYGPMGSGFIAHVDIPTDVILAFEALKNVYG